MTFASILTLVRAEDDTSVLDRVLEFAADAHVIVMVVAEAPPVPVSAYDMLNGEFWTMEVERARVLAKERADAIEQVLAARDQRGEVLAHVAGTEGLSNLVAATARYADLVVLCGEQDVDNRLQHAIVTGGLFESGSPAIFAPAGKPVPSHPAKAMIAWNATPEASRAVKAALPLLTRTDDTSLVLVDPEPGVYGHGEEPGASIARYLTHHRIKVDVVRVPSEGRSVEEVLTAQVTSTGTDLLVMGAYSHSRLRERIFGGTTHALMRNPPCPVFMAH